MKQIIDERGTGKSSRLLLLAKQNEGVVVCSNPSRMEEKALLYGLTGLKIISYSAYLRGSIKEPIYIDDIAKFLKYINPNTMGYSDSWDRSEN